MCTYRPAEGILLNYSYMHGVCGSISSQYAVRGEYGEDKRLGAVGIVDIDGGPRDDEIQAEPDNDKVKGGSGNDTLYPGPGNDEVYGYHDHNITEDSSSLDRI